MNIKIDDSQLLHLINILEFYARNSAGLLSTIKFAVDMCFKLSEARQENLDNVDIF